MCETGGYSDERVVKSRCVGESGEPMSGLEDIVRPKVLTMLEDEVAIAH